MSAKNAKITQIFNNLEWKKNSELTVHDKLYIICAIKCREQTEL